MQPAIMSKVHASVVSLHASVVQALSSVHARAAPPQVPMPLQTSSTVQNAPSSQVRPEAAGEYTVVDAVGTHAKQSFVGSVTSAATQAPLIKQPVVTGCAQASAASSQLSVVQLSVSLQSRVVPPQVPPALQVSTAVQN
jgi:hypothetical protein